MATKYIVNNLKNQVIDGSISATTISADTIVISGSPIPQPSYKVYTALLTQAGVGAPSAVVLENTIGDIVWSYINTGSYYGTLIGAFPNNKVTIFNNISNGGVQLASGRADNDNILLITRDLTNNPINGGMNSMSLEIRVYN